MLDKIVELLLSPFNHGTPIPADLLNPARCDWILKIKTKKTQPLGDGNSWSKVNRYAVMEIGSGNEGDSDREVDNPFAEPRYGTPRGARRLIKNIRKTISEFQDAHKRAASSVEQSDRDFSNDIRNTLLAEVEELKRGFPEPRQESGVIATLNGAMEILSECPAFDMREATTNVSPAYDEGNAHVSSQPQPQISEVELVAEIAVGQPTDDAANQSSTILATANAPMPGGSGDQAPISSQGDEQLNELRAKLFESGQRVMELETEMQSESRRHTQECRDIAN